MRAIVSKDFFLSQTLPIRKIDRIAISAYGGDLSGTGLGSSENFRIPAHVLEPGQVILTATEWCNLLARVQNWPASMGIINLQ
ncbi:hypothetical protein [Sporomusa sp.]|jgi:hypothetical protein|uniref:hypothetical protein n=1 Tax=Sporomusa sp. TaxID=2078658 RepID=UPI00297B234C|nr:hypothetical protein [Sporomusa sp.]MDF2570244.1 hypothetical protein [Sporomusa sp.]MDF2874870.1 hypothetical protein [Sporomusa sp.]HWR08644.1 hypothetical protein [Sporomusa sp.]